MVGRRVELVKVRASMVSVRVLMLATVINDFTSHFTHFTPVSLPFTHNRNDTYIMGERVWCGRVPPEFGVGVTNANCPPRFCHVSKFQAPDCLHYNAVKSYHPHNSDSVCSHCFPKVQLSVHQTTTSGI